MRPGEAPKNMSAETIAQQSQGIGMMVIHWMNPGWLNWASRAIEPIEDEE